MTLAKLAAQLKCASRRRKIKRAMPALWLLSDTVRLSDPRDALRQMPAGSGFIFRHYDHPEREAMARILRRLCRQRRILFLLAGDRRMAVRIGADGAHFPEGLAHRARAMRAISPRCIITVAAHSAIGVYRAYKSGADGVLLSPLFPTQSHPGAAAFGPIRFAGIASRARLPVFALGGVNARNARRLKGSGAAGIAGVSGVV